jgi:hypothetical protein
MLSYRRLQACRDRRIGLSNEGSSRAACSNDFADELDDRLCLRLGRGVVLPTRQRREGHGLARREAIPRMFLSAAAGAVLLRVVEPETLKRLAPQKSPGGRASRRRAGVFRGRGCSEMDGRDGRPPVASRSRPPANQSSTARRGARKRTVDRGGRPAGPVPL